MPLITRTFESRSSDAVYTAQYDPATGEGSCSCPGWINKRVNKPRDCKHLQELRGGAPVAPKEEAPRQEGCPGFIEPMLAHPKERQVDIALYAQGWTGELKYNGERVIACVGLTEVVTWSRPQRGNAPLIKGVPPHLKAALKQLPMGVYDGEMYVPGGKHYDARQIARSGERAIVLWDVMELNGRRLTGMPLAERRVHLAGALTHIGQGKDFVHEPFTLPTISQAALDIIWGQGLEGVMLKRLASTYQPGKRSRDWLKVKRFFHDVFRIVGYDAGESGPYSTMVLRYEADGTPCRCKTQPSHMPADFNRNPEKYIGRLFQIEHQGRTPSGAFMHPMADHLVDEV